MVDFGASDPALAVVRPDWTATQHLSIHRVGPLLQGPIVVNAELVRVGSRTVVVRGDVYDGHGIEELRWLERCIDEYASTPEASPVSRAATGLVTFARISGSAAPQMAAYDPASWIGRVRESPSDPSASARGNSTDFEVVDGEAGVLELHRTPGVTNSIGTIIGGAQAALAEAAAELFRPSHHAVDMQIHFLSQLRVGPARTAVSLVRDDFGRCVVDVELVDAGNDGTVLALATVLLHRISD